MTCRRCEGQLAFILLRPCRVRPTPTASRPPYKIAGPTPRTMPAQRDGFKISTPATRLTAAQHDELHKARGPDRQGGWPRATSKHVIAPAGRRGQLAGQSPGATTVAAFTLSNRAMPTGPECAAQFPSTGYACNN